MFFMARSVASVPFWAKVVRHLFVNTEHLPFSRKPLSVEALWRSARQKGLSLEFLNGHGNEFSDAQPSWLNCAKATI